jgi:hypothetical protein
MYRRSVGWYRLDNVGFSSVESERENFYTLAHVCVGEEFLILYFDTFFLFYLLFQNIVSYSKVHSLYYRIVTKSVKVCPSTTLVKNAQNNVLFSINKKQKLFFLSEDLSDLLGNKFNSLSHFSYSSVVFVLCRQQHVYVNSVFSLNQMNLKPYLRKSA